MADEQAKVLDARIRLNTARKLITDAIEAISGPRPDWNKMNVYVDMVQDVMPFVDVDSNSEDI